jgi:hypothetical protein
VGGCGGALPFFEIYVSGQGTREEAKEGECKKKQIASGMHTNGNKNMAT